MRTARGSAPCDRGKRPVDAGSVEQVALVEHHEIGAGDLVLEHFFDRVVMVERRVGLTLTRKRLEVGADPTVGERRAIDHRHHAVDGDAALDGGPMERLHQRLRQSEAGGLDDDVLDLRLAREDQIERGHELVGHRAAQAAIGELDDVLLRAGGIAAAFEDLAVDADIAELVDDHREPSPVGIGEHMADQRRLARAEKARDDGAGDAGKRRAHSLSSSKSMGGTRAISPRFRISGRPRQGIRPSLARANSLRAFDQRVGVPRLIEPAEHVSPGAVAPDGGAQGCGCNWRDNATCRTVTPVPSAARAVSRARRRPGRTPSSGSLARLQVMQT